MFVCVGRKWTDCLNVSSTTEASPEPGHRRRPALLRPCACARVDACDGKHGWLRSREEWAGAPGWCHRANPVPLRAIAALDLQCLKAWYSIWITKIQGRLVETRSILASVFTVSWLNNYMREIVVFIHLIVCLNIPIQFHAVKRKKETKTNLSKTIGFFDVTF